MTIIPYLKGQLTCPGEYIIKLTQEKGLWLQADGGILLCIRLLEARTMVAGFFWQYGYYGDQG